GGNKGICVTGSGENAPAVSDVLRRFEHRVTRADACEDWEEEGLFDRLSGALLDFAQSSRLTINQQGDWIRGRARSLYLGSKSSSCQLVLYEKGDQLGINRPWVRLEARVYPKGDAGYQVASWVPGEAFGASRWMTQALERIGWDHLQAKSVGTVWRPSDALRARLQLVRQYKATLRSWVEEAGSWDAMGAEFELLRDQVESNTLGQEVSDVVLLH
ncbi:MAG: hypothetical protein KC561_16155, partial [Myxococcales bacterium]|nr:hypothetical protein [Myxococcales bacterium]